MFRNLPFTNIISPLRPSIWANLLNEVEEALIETRLNPSEWMPCHVWMGALECQQREMRCDSLPLSAPLSPYLEGGVQGISIHKELALRGLYCLKTRLLPHSLFTQCSYFSFSSSRLCHNSESSGSFCVSGSSPEPILRNMFSVEALVCFAKCVILLQQKGL